MVSVAENYKKIREEIDRLGRGHVEIIGVTKRQPVEKVIEGIRAGVTKLGVNQVQAGAELRSRLSAEMVQWHFIGHIQRRKARDLVAYDCVESLDRIAVAEDLNSRLKDSGKILPVLIEINLGKESGKSGILSTELETFLQQLSEYSCLKPVGLMALPPPLRPVDKLVPYFAELRTLGERFALSELSMGTSEDYLVAVREGATRVRLGTALYGTR